MKAILLSIFLFVSGVLNAQQNKFIAHTNNNGIYIEHKVMPKENWYSVGRAYFISPKEIASFNGLTLEKGLSIGQLINVPLTSVNFLQSTASNGVPVYHVVQPKEGLLRIAGTYGLDLNGIKNLNGLKTDQIGLGYSLIVGYLAAGSTNVSGLVTDASKTNKAVPAKELTASVVTPKAEVKPIPGSDKPKESVVIPVGKSVEQSTQPKTQTPSTFVKTGTGFFAGGFDQQAKEGKEQRLDNPAFGVFKSSSGWQDGKYYLLMNDAVPGTIVKIGAVESGKTIHAKVLGAVPPGKESEGLALRLSNAAAAALGMQEGANGSVFVVWFK
jgi:hypothetical protein